MILDDTKDLVSTRCDRLEELLHLMMDPLFAEIDKKNYNITKYLEENDIIKKESFDIASLPNIKDETVYKETILKSIAKNIYHPKKISNKESPISLGKRKADTDDINRRRQSKIHKSNQMNKFFKKKATRIQYPSSKIASLRSQKEVTEEETLKFLDKDINDLEILSLPELYPTKPHTVSPLAELYYLTQTLPLIKLLPGCHKTLMTENFESALLEGKIAVLYSRIEELKRQGKWSLRQPLRYYDPLIHEKKNKRKAFHWDNLLDEGKWMAADFKESIKYKKACCVNIAQAVSDYWNYGKVMCIRRKPIEHLDEERETKVNNAVIEDSAQATEREEVVIDCIQEETEAASNKLQEKQDHNQQFEQTEIQPDESSMKVEEAEPSTIDVKLLLSRPKPEDEIIPHKLPEYSQEDISKIRGPESVGPFKLHVDLDDLKKIDQSIIKNLPKFTAFDDYSRNMPIQPLKPVDYPMAAVSRFLHPLEEDDVWYKIVVKDTSSETNFKESHGLPEYQKGLFGFQSHRRFNYLKPPKPPLIKNIEYRSPTIWLPQDDKYLIHYVAEFCFNWELISEHLSSSSASLNKYESNIERRTPWQCFERYIQLNEKFQFSDMKGIYAYHAQQWLEQAHRAQSTTKRRISPLGVGNDSIQRGHRRLRWATMFDAMRKCMKKREIALSKISQRTSSASNGSSQTSSSSISSNGSTNGNNGSSNDSTTVSTAKRQVDRIPTPAELSRLKFERDKSIQEAYLNQQATRSRMMAAVAQQQKQQNQNNSNNRPQVPQPSIQAPNSSNSPPQQRVSVNTTANNIGPGTKIQAPNGTLGNQIPQQPQPSQQQVQAAGMIKRATTPNGTPYTAEQIQQLLQIQKQRRLMQQQNQAGKTNVNPTQTSNPVLMQNLPANNKPIISNSNPNVQGQTVPHQQPQNVQQQVPQSQHQSQSQPNQNLSASNAKARIHFAPAQVSAIINSIQTKNPGLSKEQVTKLAATYLANIQQQQQNRLNQQQLNQGSSNRFSSSVPHRVNQPQSPAHHKSPQVATLTPQERNQLQMLKAAKTAQQQQLQQQRQQQQSKTTSPMMGAPPLDANNLSKLEYEQRKKLLIQKHQQQQRLAAANANVASIPVSASPLASTPSSASSSLGTPNNGSSNQNAQVSKK